MIGTADGRAHTIENRCPRSTALRYPRIAEAGHHGRGDVESVAPFENGGQKSLHRKDFIVDGLDGRGIGRHLHGHIARSVSAMPTRDVVDDPGDLIRGVRIDQ